MAVRDLEKISNEELAALYYKGERSALDELIKKNQKYLKNISGRFERYLGRFITAYDEEDGYGVPHCQDIFQSAQIGLAKAIMSGSYDSTKGMVLTYATPFIEGEIKRFIAENSTGYTMKKTRFYKTMDSDGRREAAPFCRISIAAESDGDEYGYPVLPEDELAANSIPPDKAAYSRIMRKWIDNLCAHLPLLERQVLIYSYGLFNKPQLTRREIAYWLGKTEKTISAMLRRAEVKVIAKGAPCGMREFRRIWRRVNRGGIDRMIILYKNDLSCSTHDRLSVVTPNISFS
ncbi:MAG: sigma-70 family RNA polymerase sigma factor, partial [Ruminococcus sp.]|nr:sigma-70 family RNA polymerase sigma factor [Ruminococcus sp.]